MSRDTRDGRADGARHGQTQALPTHDAEQLAAGAQALGLALTPQQLTGLLAFRDLLLRWNRVHNLTALRAPGEALTHHLLDSLAALPPLLRHLAGQAWDDDGADERADEGAEEAAKMGGQARNPNTGARDGHPPTPHVIDVGSGGGLPGLVWALAAPQITIVCVDSVAKKVAFIRQAAAELGLPRLTAVHTRVEQWAGAPARVVTSRAFASLADFVRWTEPVLAPGGVWLAMKGRVPHDEIAALPVDVEVFHVEPLQVPGLAAERCIVWMRRRARN